MLTGFTFIFFAQKSAAITRLEERCIAEFRYVGLAGPADCLP